MTWPAVAAKLIDNLPAIIASVAACLAYLQSRKNGTVVATRADSQDQKLDDIHEATNGGVQLLRNQLGIAVSSLGVANQRILALEALLKVHGAPPYA